jgi:hypothetical protein
MPLLSDRRDMILGEAEVSVAPFARMPVSFEMVMMVHQDASKGSRAITDRPGS